jgi:hypothetical protein
MLFVGPSPLVSGPGYRLAQMYPKLARDAKLNGLFSRGGLKQRSTIGEFYGQPTETLGPYTMHMRGGNAIEPPASCIARYANFAATAREANAEFVQRGERVYLVATRAIRPNEEILTYRRHTPVAHPTRDANRAYAHIRQAMEYAKNRETRDKALRHAVRAEMRAREALRAIGEANDLAFGGKRGGSRTSWVGAKRTLVTTIARRTAPAKGHVVRSYSARAGKADTEHDSPSVKRASESDESYDSEAEQEKRYTLRTTGQNEGWALFNGTPPLVNEWTVRTDDDGEKVLSNVNQDDRYYSGSEYRLSDLASVLKEAKAKRRFTTREGDQYTVLWKRSLMKGDRGHKIYELERSDGQRVLAKSARSVAEDGPARTWHILTADDDQSYRKEEKERQEKEDDENSFVQYPETLKPKRRVT